MTPADEATFIALWQQGLTHETMARQLGCPVGPVKSRSYTLLHQGKIQPRRRRAQARQDGSPPPGQSSAVQDSAVQTPSALVPSPAATSAAIIDLLRQTLARLDTVEQDLKAIREDRPPSAEQRSAVQSGTVQSSAEIPTLTPDDAKAERWNLWLPRGLRQRIEAIAKARGHAPSKVVQEALWRWLGTEETHT